MKIISLVPVLLAVAIATGCASTDVSDRTSRIGDEMLARPQTIHVYPFAADLADIPRWSESAARYAQPAAPLTAEEITAGRELGAMVAEALAANFREMGLNSVEASSATLPSAGDMMIVGYFQAIEEGDRRKRIGLGFGSGAAELTTLVEGYQMTPNGPRLLGQGTVDSQGAKTPGVATSMVVLAATANPVGLVVSSTAHLAAERSGRDRIEGAAKRTADFIADELEVRFAEQGWID